FCGNSFDTPGKLGEDARQRGVVLVRLEQSFIACLAQGRDLALEPAHALLQFRQLVHDHDARHHGDALIADLAEGILEMGDIAVETLGKVDQVFLLTLLASHAIGLAIYSDRYLGHIIRQTSIRGCSTNLCLVFSVVAGSQFADRRALFWNLPNGRARRGSSPSRSEEHTSELQSRENLVCRLL